MAAISINAKSQKLRPAKGITFMVHRGQADKQYLWNVNPCSMVVNRRMVIGRLEIGTHPWIGCSESRRCRIGDATSVRAARERDRRDHVMGDIM
jgi:hypothetical protein